MTDLQLVYILAAIGAVLAAEAAYLFFSESKGNRDRMNRRVRLSVGTDNRQDVLVSIRKERGIGADGGPLMALAWLSRLVVQSGLTLGLGRLALAAVASATACGIAAFVGFGDPVKAVAAFLFGGTLLPVFVLNWFCKRRRKRFADQLPEAIELIVRSLKAGHPVPVAIGLVGREMPDPVGTEFGIVGDEVTYGSDLVSALRRMQERVGQEDLPLFLTAVSIQSTSGGNLREILQGLSDVIRQRIKMRRKIKAISAEGRISAYVLTAMPVLLLTAIMIMSPDYYGEVMHEEATMQGLIGAGVWLLMGNLVLRKMLNFRM